MFRQTRRCAARAHRDQHRIAVQHARQGKIAELGAVGDIHQQAQPFQPQTGFLRLARVLQRDERKPRAMRLCLAHHDAARTLHQPRLGIGGIAMADNHHPAARDPVEQGQRMHQESQSGTRSASMISPAGIRSATVAKRAPSTNTSATKPREL